MYYMIIKGDYSSFIFVIPEIITVPSTHIIGTHHVYWMPLHISLYILFILNMLCCLQMLISTSETWANTSFLSKFFKAVYK